MGEAELRQELVELKKDNQQLKKELEQTQAELRGWEHNAILLTPEEIFTFSRRYREEKAREQERKNKVVMMEIDKLMVSVAELRGGVSDNDESV